MAGITDFIQMAAQQLGESEGTTKSATGALLGVLQQNADGGDFKQLLGAIPGASGLLSAGAAAGESSGGGGLMGAVGSMLGGGGGGIGGALGAIASIQKSGISGGNVGGLVSLFMTFAKSQAGEGLIQRILGSVPELAKLAG